MENQQEKEGFRYTYSSKEQEELKRIRQKYIPKEEDKMEQLRRLDESVTQKATILSLVVGIVGTLIMGVGMCCTIVWMGMWFVPGIIIGMIGIGIAALAYPLYSRILQKERERIAPEILRLTDELLQK